jgi:FecR protein
MPGNRGPLNERHVADALRTLANEHAREREPADKRRSWQRIEQRGARALKPETGHWRVSLAAAVCLVGALTGAAYFRSAATLHYEAHGTALRDGNLSTGNGTAHLDFSDESQISVSPHSTFNVDVVGKHAALTRLVQGTLHVRVHHEADTNWRFFAGRYEVQVVGTEFDLAWDDKTESLTLTMQSGRVRVLGAPGAPRLVLGGSTLHMPETLPREAALTPDAMPTSGTSTTTTSERGASTSAPATVAALDTAAPLRASEAQTPRAAARDTAALDWDALLRAGRFAAVIQAAEAQGIDHALQTANGSDVKALAQAARYTGRAPLSLRAWQTLRTRFTSQPLGAQASFFLGRTYEEQGNSAEALRWLGTYVSEAPAGVYASEALGRKLLLLSKISGKSAALGSAREYLQRFPGGAYEKTARAIVEAE